MTYTRSRRQAGFTMIELLIATTVFSVMLLVVTVAILNFSKQYYKGVISSSTQTSARALVDDVSRSLQFSGGDFSPLAGGNGYCIGAKLYSYKLNQQVTDQAPSAGHQGPHGLVSTSVTGCNPATPPENMSAALSASALAANGRELLNDHTRLVKFDIASSSDLYTVTVRIAYGDDDLLCSPSEAGDCTSPNSTHGVSNNKPDLVCRSTAGSQFCAVSELTTTVKKRVN